MRMSRTTSINANALPAFPGGISVSQFVAAGGFWYFNRALSAGLDPYLRQNVIGGPSNATFQRAGIKLLRRKLFVDGLEFHGNTAEGVQWNAKIDEISLQVPLPSLSSGKL